MEEGGLVIYTEDALPVNHEYTGGPYGGYVLLPLGLRLNRELVSAKTGQALEFAGGERARLVLSRVMRCSDAVTGALCLLRYGLNIKDMRDNWRRDAVLAGAGLGAIDSDECLVLFYKRKAGV